MERQGDWMQTHSGLRFYPLDPRSEDLRIEDIAHALSMLCRFNGHVERFYSVAEHSVIVATAVAQVSRDSRMILTALLHDASEAYLSDVPRPLKRMPEMEPYRRMERLLEEAIAERFNLFYPLPDSIKYFDHVALMTERRDLVPNAILSGWTGTPVEPFSFSVRTGPSIAEARETFLELFDSYGGRRG